MKPPVYDFAGLEFQVAVLKRVVYRLMAHSSFKIPDIDMILIRREEKDKLEAKYPGIDLDLHD